MLFNRSWYNRAGVERVMGFCTKQEYENFSPPCPPSRRCSIDSASRLVKYYLDIDKHEQKQRLQARRRDPLKQWKISPVDTGAPKLWKAYSRARDAMFARTIPTGAVDRRPRRRQARGAAQYHPRPAVALDYAGGRAPHRPDPDIVFAYDERYLDNGMIAK